MKATAAKTLKKCAQGGEGKCVSRDLLMYDGEVILQSNDGCIGCSSGQLRRLEVVPFRVRSSFSAVFSSSSKRGYQY